MAFMTWFYWTSFFFIAGAELNAELAKGTKAGPLRQKDKTLLTPHWTARHKKELMRCEFGGKTQNLVWNLPSTETPPTWSRATLTDHRLLIL
jgi:hypothetical protein